MKKDKTLRNKTYLDGVFPQVFPHAQTDGETNLDDQPSLDKIWDWLGNPDDY